MTDAPKSLDDQLEIKDKITQNKKQISELNHIERQYYIDNAKHIARKLKDEKFYKLCSETTLKRYENYYTEEVFVKHWNRIWDEK